jgi:hypothetical protein
MPLPENQGLGIALVSYLEKMFWGFTADWDLVPDLHDLVEAVRVSIRDLIEIAEGSGVELSDSEGTAVAEPSPRRERRTVTRLGDRSHRPLTDLE